FKPYPPRTFTEEVDIALVVLKDKRMSDLAVIHLCAQFHLSGNLLRDFAVLYVYKRSRMPPAPEAMQPVVSRYFECGRLVAGILRLECRNFSFNQRTGCIDVSHLDFHLDPGCKVIGVDPLKLLPVRVPIV